MTHDHSGGCCGGASNTNKSECKTGGCCGKSGLMTGVAVLVAVLSLGYAAMGHNGGGDRAHKPKIDASKLIVGEDTVVAKINGHNVKKSEVAASIKELGANVPPENIDQILPAFTEQYINLELINEAAKKAGTDKKVDVQEQLYNSRQQIVRAAYLRDMFEGKISEDTLKAAYKAKFEDQPMPQEMRARHILVDSEDKAKELIIKLETGASFEKLAAENSKDPSAQRGGDLGYFAQSEMVKEFGDAAFAMKPGQMTKVPVKTQFGYHIIKAEDKRQRAKPSFEEAKGPLEQEARQVILDAKLKEMREAAKVEVLNAAQPAAGETAAPAPEAAPAAE